LGPKGSSSLPALPVKFPKSLGKSKRKRKNNKRPIKGSPKIIKRIPKIKLRIKIIFTKIQKRTNPPKNNKPDRKTKNGNKKRKPGDILDDPSEEINIFIKMQLLLTPTLRYGIPTESSRQESAAS